MSGSVDLLIKNGLIVFPDNVRRGNLAIQNGYIVGIFEQDEEMRASEVRDITGMVVFPGLIDTHAHFWEPGPQNYREDFRHGTQCCAAGGVTTVLEMPLSIPPVVDSSSFKLKYDIAKRNSVVDFGLWGGLIPTSVENQPLLDELGCCAFKVFISYANPDYPHMPDHQLCRAFEVLKTFDGLVGIHAENADIVKNFCDWFNKKGVREPERYHEGRPPFSEVEAVQRAILFGHEYGVRVLICHMSAAEGVDVAAKARAKGEKVFTETCPHYLAFDNQTMKKFGVFAKCNPPLRPKENKEKLWAHIFSGDIDVLGSDHGPYGKEEKLASADNIWDAFPGFGGVELMLPVMLTEGHHNRKLPLSNIAKLCSTNAARIFGLKDKGEIAIGKHADLCIVNLDEVWEYKGFKSFSKTKIDCGIYEGYKAKGRVYETIVRGKSVYKDGKILLQPGYGEFVPRAK